MVDLTEITFFAMIVATIGGAITALEAREIVYGAIGLAFSFFGVAGIFFLLDAPFVAVFQITVYIGAVAVLILFTVMLVREGRWMRDSLGSLEQGRGPPDRSRPGLVPDTRLRASSFLGAVEQTTAPSFVGIGRVHRRAVRARARAPRARPRRGDPRGNDAGEGREEGTRP